MIVREIPAAEANHGKRRDESGIGFIVIHYTAGMKDTAAGNGKYFSKNVTKSSAHYFVDGKEVVRSVPDDVVAWHCGGKKLAHGGRLHGVCSNSNSIGVELCNQDGNVDYRPTEKTVGNAIELVGILMKKYGIPKENVIRHFDVNGKKCPAYWTDDEVWEREFLSRIRDPELFTGIGIKDGAVYEVVDGKAVGKLDFPKNS